MTAVFNDEKLWNHLILQPVPDYVRFYTSGGKMHYLRFEQRVGLPDGPWNNIPEMFLPSRI